MSYSYSDPPSCCSTASAELKLYQAFIFSIPIFFTFILLFLFYLFYLRRRRVDWSSLRMRAPYHNNGELALPRLSESGLKKELREMLPIIVFKESFSIRDTQCSVCLGDYQAEERLQQIPACGHTFHMSCIDHWLATHTTCPLCRLSLLLAAKTDTEPPDNQLEAQANEIQTNEGLSEDSNGDGNSLRRRSERESIAEEGGNNCVSNDEELCNARREDDECQRNGEGSVIFDVEDHVGGKQETMTDPSVQQGNMRDHP